MDDITPPHLDNGSLPTATESTDPNAAFRNAPDAGVGVVKNKSWKPATIAIFVLIFAGLGTYALLTSFAETATATKTWSSSGDWNSGVLANTVVSGNAVTLTPTVTTTTGSGTGSSCATPVLQNNSTNSITDSAGYKWTVTGGVVYRNNAKAGFTANVLEIAYVKNVIWQENNNHLWWSWNGTNGWNGGSGIKNGPVLTYGTCAYTPVLQNNSTNSITDSAGYKWTVTGGVVYRNNAKAGFTANVLEIAYVKNVIWQENNNHLWWSWNGTNGWNGGSGITTSPLISGGGGTTTVTTYPSNGTITLTFNATGIATWKTLTDQATTPSGTVVNFEFRTSANDSTWSGWTGDFSQLVASQYLQIQVTLSTTKTSASPALNNVTLTYVPPQNSGTGGGGTGGGTGGGGTTSGGLTLGNSAPPSGTNAVVDFRTNLNTPALNVYSIGDTLSTYGVPNDYVGNATWRNELAALGPLAWRVPLRDTNGTPTGAGGGGGGTGYVQDIKDMNGVPVVIAAGQSGDDDFNNGQITSLVKYYNDNNGQNGGPVTSWIVGNEPESGSGGGWSGYVNNLPGVVNAMESADPNIPLKIAAGTVWDQGDISMLSNIAGDKNLSYLTWHAYQAADNNGNNSGQYSGPLYESEEQQAASIASAHGELSGIEEFNWNSGCNNNTYPQFNKSVNADFIASVIGNVLAGGGAHAYMYADSNGCGTLAASGNNGGLAEYTQLPAYWALGMWTGMNGKFDRFGSNLVDTKVNSVDVTNPGGKENAGLQHEVELFATNNGKILAINENGSTNETVSIGLGGVSSGKYNVWQSNGSEGTSGAPTEVTSGASFSGSQINITLPAGSISSIDVSN